MILIDTLSLAKPLTGKGLFAIERPGAPSGHPALPLFEPLVDAPGRYVLDGSHTHGEALCRYRDDGRAELDINAAERALRAIAVGRKDHIFAGADSGGERAAGIYSLIGSAQLNGLDPEDYLRCVLERIADHPINKIEALLPWKLVATQPQLRS